MNFNKTTNKQTNITTTKIGLKMSLESVKIVEYDWVKTMLGKKIHFRDEINI